MEIFIILFILLNLCLALGFLKFFGKEGLIVFHILLIILVQITINVQVSFFGHPLVFGSVLFAVLFMTVDLLSEHYGKKEGYKTVFMGTFTLVVFIAAINAALYLPPADTATLNDEFKTLFSGQWRITLADLVVSYFALQTFNVWFFDKIRTFTKGRHLWLRNNLATFVSQTLIAILFFQLAFAGTIPQNQLWEIILTGLVIKYAISLLDTPFMYLSRYCLPKNYLREKKFCEE